MIQRGEARLVELIGKVGGGELQHMMAEVLSGYYQMLIDD